MPCSCAVEGLVRRWLVLSGVGHESGDTEVENLGIALRGDEDVGRFEVEVNDARRDAPHRGR